MRVVVVIRHIAARETSVPRHKGGQIWGPSETLQINNSVMSMGFQGIFNWSPMMPRDASLSDSYTPDRCCYSYLAQT